MTSWEIIKELTSASDEKLKQYAQECCFCLKHGRWPLNGKIYSYSYKANESSDFSAMPIIQNIAFEYMKRNAGEREDFK